MVVEARVVTSTEPTHVKWIVVPIMVGIDCYAPANLAGLFLEIACLYCTMNSEVMMRKESAKPRVCARSSGMA